MHGLGRGRVLDELDDVVLEDDLARRGRDVAADLEGLDVGLADLQDIARLLHVVDEVGHALHEVLAAGAQRLAQHHGIGEGKIRGRQRACQLLEVELGALARALVEALGIVEHVLEPARGDEIGLLPEVEVGVAAPLRIVEAIVAGLGLGHGQRLRAHHALRGRPGELQVVAGERRLRLGHLGGIGQPMLGDLGEQPGGLRCLAGKAEGPAVAIGALEEARHDPAGLLRQAQHVAAEFLRIGNAIGAEVDFGRQRLAHLWGFLLHRSLGG